MLSIQIETEKPNSVAFSIPLEGSAASPEKVIIIKERLEKRLQSEVPEVVNLEEVNERLSKANQLRETRIKE